MFLCFLHCQVGGYEVIKDKFPKAFPQTMLDNMNNSNYSYKDCGVPPDNFFHLMHDPSEDDLPWTGVVFGLTVSGMWYWCSDQVIVQRALAAKVYRSLLDIIYHIVYVNFFSLSLLSNRTVHAPTCTVYPYTYPDIRLASSSSYLHSRFTRTDT